MTTYCWCGEKLLDYQGRIVAQGSRGALSIEGRMIRVDVARPTPWTWKCNAKALQSTAHTQAGMKCITVECAGRKYVMRRVGWRRRELVDLSGHCLAQINGLSIDAGSTIPKMDLLFAVYVARLIDAPFDVRI
ncbi:DNA repair protein [Corynebacterium rouxii]|uniref:DNA repair protein n=1 Tax=Corynebacterium rouxii TaxID=2719119 RepID=UPI00313F2709